MSTQNVIFSCFFSRYVLLSNRKEGDPLDKKQLIGLRIKTMRQSRKMTQADLARAINQSQSSITMYECGRREPDFETLEALADVFNVSLPSIVGDENEYEMDPHIRIVSGMMENMSEEQKKQIVAIVRAVVGDQK